MINNIFKELISSAIKLVVIVVAVIIVYRAAIWLTIPPMS